ncbi:MAG: LacI family DNA-binding transcriptional regulator [Lachnospiraceae bacterium]|nr:LacI family DNA-binding transcriptional regulator [Lachnospiraceae bacterium]
MREKKITIQDVADRSGVSKATVSKYLNRQYQFMSKETAARIAGVIRELDYRPSMTARSLKARHSRLIGVVMPHVWSMAIAHSIQSVCAECAKNGYAVIICSAEDSPAQETECINRLIDQRVDGILCYSGGVNRRYRDAGVPVVVTNRYQEDCPLDMVIIENYDIVKTALETLRKDGYESIAYVTTRVTPLSNKIIREKAFDDYVAENGLEDLFPKYTAETGSIHEFAKILADFGKSRPGKKKAVFASSNSTLRRVMTAIEMEKSIPRDLGLCGYELGGGNEDSLVPGALLLQYPLNQMAKQAVDLLISRIEGDKADMPMRIKIEPRLIRCPDSLLEVK